MREPQSSYRSDIDWLRAVAVIAVIGFHFEISGFRGGFVGVDIFFVISGYLIGGIVLAELDAGTFSFADFWRRRARRILPALYVMVAVTTLPALVILLAPRTTYLQSVASVAAFASNFFFWLHSGYFDRTAVDAPLLHTWSLAVEEQFYVVFPIIAMLLHRLGALLRRRSVLWLGFALAGAVSLAVSQRLAVSHDAAAAFYLPHSRAWEFLLGVLLARVRAPQALPAWTPAAAKIVGLVLIVIAVNSLTSGTPFPGLNALLPCLGAALFLVGGPFAAPTSRVLGAVQGIGRISYSLYLWHWPLFTLVRHATLVQMPSPAGKAMLLIVLLVLSWLSWRFVEQPLRRWRAGSAATFGAAAVGAAALCCVGALSLIGNGAVYRDDPRFTRLSALKNFNFGPYSGPDDCFSGVDWSGNTHAGCFARHHEAAVLLWGDSMAAQYRPGLLVQLRGQNIDLLQASGAHCAPTLSGLDQADHCNALGRRVGSYVASTPPSLVVISAFWNEYIRTFGFDRMIGALREAAGQFTAAGSRVAILGPGMQFRADLPEILILAERRDITPTTPDIVRMELFDLDRRMRAALEGSGAIYLSPIDVACPDRVCRLMATKDMPMTWDFGHLTVEGSEIVTRGLWPQLRAAVPTAASGG